ncbi:MULTISPECIES: hypothetical protein [Bacillus amyloliquefaciens group]|uniref:hypothetical protein n=1 Tax=Bacillus amyloliquefaciens group TaxID=1938374 RepID=UPI0018E7E4CA|nr:hypothetical protein [Bacillus velezensis]
MNKQLKALLLIAVVCVTLFLLRGLIMQLLGIGLVLFIVAVGAYFLFRLFAGILGLVAVVAGCFITFGLIFAFINAVI